MNQLNHPSITNRFMQKCICYLRPKFITFLLVILTLLLLALGGIPELFGIAAGVLLLIWLTCYLTAVLLS